MLCNFRDLAEKWNWPEVWTPRCRPAPSKKWKDKIWVRQCSKWSKFKNSDVRRSLNSYLTDALPFLVTDDPPGNTPTVDDLAKCKRILSKLVVGFTDKSKGDVWAA